MSRRYNFGQSADLLRTNPKTFLKWLAEDGIDASKQRDRADPRQKYITEEQLIQMAKQREIELHLPDPDRKPESSATRLLAAVNERFAALELQMTHRFDRMEAQLQTFMADVRRDLESQVKVTPSPPEYAPVAPPKPERPKPLPARTSKKSRTKKGTKAKALPKALVPLALFKSEHKVSDKAVEYALEKRKITVERGRWTYNNRNVMVALGKLGQHEFYALFHEREKFQRCEQCPHEL